VAITNTKDYATLHPSSVDTLSFWLGLSWGKFTCVGWQVTLWFYVASDTLYLCNYFPLNSYLRSWTYYCSCLWWLVFIWAFEVRCCT